MRPTKETEDKRIKCMLAMQTLANNIELEELNPLLAGIVIAALRNPLLRMVAIDEKPHIAHILACGPKGIIWKFDDNPLENKSSEGDLRISAMEDSNVLLVEKNIGKVPENEVSRSINERMASLKSSMMRTGDYLGRAGEEYSHLLHMTTRSHGSAFIWKRFTAYSLSDFETLKIVTRKEKNGYGFPTFDLVLSLSEMARKSRQALREP